MNKLSSRSKSNMEGVDPRLLSIVDRALVLSKVDFGIPGNGGLRSEVEQADLYRANKSMLDGIRKRSKHQDGLALDVFAYVDGKASWDMGHLTTVAAAMLQAASELGYKLKWGGHWVSFIDAPHFELIEG